MLLIRHLPDAKPPECVCHPRWDCEHSSVNPQPRDPCLCINDLSNVDGAESPAGVALPGQEEVDRKKLTRTMREYLLLEGGIFVKISCVSVIRELSFENSFG